MSDEFSAARRRALRSGLAAAAGVVAVKLGTAARIARAEDAPKLDEADPQAVALGYNHDTNAVDGAKFATHKPEQHCAVCALYTAQGDGSWGNCAIFAGKQVNAGGWCSAFAPKG